MAPNGDHLSLIPTWWDGDSNLELFLMRYHIIHIKQRKLQLLSELTSDYIRLWNLQYEVDVGTLYFVPNAHSAILQIRITKDRFRTDHYLSAHLYSRSFSVLFPIFSSLSLSPHQRSNKLNGHAALRCASCSSVMASRLIT